MNLFQVLLNVEVIIELSRRDDSDSTKGIEIEEMLVARNDEIDITGHSYL